MEDKATIKAKKIQCFIGLFFLIPPVLGVIAFVLQLFDIDLDFSTLRFLNGRWLGSTGGGMSAAPIYMALMALAGAYLIKDNLKYLFISKDEKKDVQ